MFSPPVPYPSLDEGIRAAFGSGQSVVSMTGVSGGDINRAYRLTLKDGARVFMKANTRDNLAFFTAEAEGLSAIAAAGAIRTPELLGTGTDDRYGAFLLLSWAEAGPKSGTYWETFGANLAAMHLADASALVSGGRFGFLHDNFIGSRRQINSPRGSWTAFFRDCRQAPKLQAADRRGYFDAEDRKRITKLLDRLDEHLTEPERPSLLHGDLWSGNFITGEDGEAWLIDPAAYVGHAEADIAMTELFGGFPPAFYGAYREAHPLQPEYGHRRDLYNLYHLVNHLLMFGAAYLGPVRRILRAYGS
ncbi:MAG: fructosamine kinase family protein [Oscillospiraceae bacterium]|nr:fructosamine kinase family protein [Oscillospiraceae bacterium]